MAEYIERGAVLDLFDDGKWQGQICIDAVKKIPASGPNSGAKMDKEDHDGH